MARNHANNGRIYRAVIVKTMADGRTFTSHYGPYDTAAPAKARITSAKNEAEWTHSPYRNPAYAYTATGYVESSEVVWMREAQR